MASKKELIINDIQYLIKYYRIKVFINKRWENPGTFIITSNKFHNIRNIIFLGNDFINGEYESFLFQLPNLSLYYFMKYITKKYV